MNWNQIIQALKARPITWVAKAGMPRHYGAIIDDVEYTLRLNDFPDEPICTIFQGAENEGVDVEGIPMHWHWKEE